MKYTTIETKSGSYSFVSETDADLSTSEGRIEWFCAHFDVAPPKLQYDEDEPTQIALTDELMEWVKREGVNLDWAFCGRVSGVLAAYRERNRVTPKSEEWISLLGGFDDQEHDILLAGLMLIVKSGADIDSVMRGVAEQIEEYRAGKTQ
tara:strand:- start:1140 stop:1586 length:447 start_codon:yes stop_codon:yes gene_type:complete